MLNRAENGAQFNSSVCYLCIIGGIIVHCRSVYRIAFHKQKNTKRSARKLECQNMAYIATICVAIYNWTIVFVMNSIIVKLLYN